MKTTCKRCGIVDKPHHCPYTSYNNDREDKKLYRDIRWKKLRKQILEDYNSICLWSLYVDGKIRIANVVHHIQEVLANKNKAFDYDNVIPLEYINHELVHKLYKKDKARVQWLLSKMIYDYKHGDKTLGKYKNYF